MKPHDTTGVNRHINYISKQRMHCNVWLAERSRAPALWRHDKDGNNQYTVFLSMVQRRLAMFTKENSTSKRNVNVMKSM